MNAVDELAGALCSISRPAVMRRFLSELHTPSELRDMALRWRLMKMLKLGRTQREIARDLKISLCKITRGSRILKDRASVTNRVINPSADLRPGGRRVLQCRTRRRLEHQRPGGTRINDAEG